MHRYWYRHHNHNHHFATWSWYKEILVFVCFVENNFKTRSHFRRIFSTEFYLIVSSCFAIPTKFQPLAPYRLSVRCRLTWMWSHTQHCFGQSLLYMNTAVWKVIKLLGSVHGKGREQQHPTPQMKTKQLCRSPCTWTADSNLAGLYIMAEYFHLNIGSLTSAAALATMYVQAYWAVTVHHYHCWHNTVLEQRRSECLVFRWFYPFFEPRPQDR